MNGVRDDGIVVFLGPSLPLADARPILPALYLGPVRCGDILRVRRLRPRMIAIIDGLFDVTPPVWHKEILLAIEDGIAVFGAASMGALRAAELAPFGMVGMGAIFEAYRDGTYADDDEVALLHGTAEEGYRALTVPMVNIRASVARAVQHGVISARVGRRIVLAAKATFYQDRTMESVIARAWPRRTLHADAVRFREFIGRGGYVDQKRLDAVRLLQHLAGVGTVTNRSQPAAIGVYRSRVLLKLHHDVMCRPFAAVAPDLPLEEHVALEARLLGVKYRLLRGLAQLMSVAFALATAGASGTPGRHLRDVYQRDDFGLGRSARNRRWATANDLTDAGREQCVQRLAAIRKLLGASERAKNRRDVERRVLTLMRIEGRFVSWRPRGRPPGPGSDRAVLRHVARRGGLEFALYRRMAKLWLVVDDAAQRLGVKPADDPQSMFDEFRLSRGLSLRRATLAWLRDNNLDHAAFADLVAADARLSLLMGESGAYTLSLHEEPAPICWLHDAIRLAGLYPRLKRRVLRTRTDSAGDRRTTNVAALYRRHFSRIGEPVPDDVEAYACSLDFRGGEVEFRSALTRS